MKTTDTENKLPDDPLIMVYLRNAFYQQKYYLALGLYLLNILVVIILSGMVIYLIKNPTAPLYFPADDFGRLIREIPLTQSNMSLEEATAWTIEAVETAYSYDYVNFRSQLQNAQKYFSAFGWYKYMQGLKTSNNLLALTQRKMIFVAKVVEKPKLLGEGILGTGYYGYKFEIPVLVTYMLPPFDGKTNFQNPLIVSVVVQRQNILSSYKGLGVMQMNARIAITPQAQNLSAPPQTP